MISHSTGLSSYSLPRRDRTAILSALVGTTVLAWAYIVFLWANMPSINMSTSDSIMQMHPWMPADFAFMFFMWAIMMVGMMLPSATPMILLYAGMVRKAERQGTPMAPTVAFVCGYLAIWCMFSVGATLLQWGLHEAAWLSPMMRARSSGLGGSLLMIAGLYQLTPWKNVCLDHCRSPAHFLSHHWRRSEGSLSSGPRTWCVLSGLLLGHDGVAFFWRGHESPLDCWDQSFRVSRKNVALWYVGRASSRWRIDCSRGACSRPID